MKNLTNFKKIIIRVTQTIIFLMICINTHADYVMDINVASKLEKRDYQVLAEDGNLIIDARHKWSSDYNLTLWTHGNIIFKENAKIINTGNGSIYLKAGMEPGNIKNYNGTIIFQGDNPQIELHGSGKVRIYYNPQKSSEPVTKINNKYQNPNYNYFRNNITIPNSNHICPYMLVNNIQDLRDIVFLLHGNFALSQDIDATITKDWDEGKGFRPLRYQPKRRSFYGDFDGNDYTIKNLFINRPEEDEVGLFGKCIGKEDDYGIIENLHLENFNLKGKKFVGALAGKIVRYNIKNVSVGNSIIEGEDIIGGVIGSVHQTEASLIDVNNMPLFNLKLYNPQTNEIKGMFSGGAAELELRPKEFPCGDDYKGMLVKFGFGGDFPDYNVNINPIGCGKTNDLFNDNTNINPAETMTNYFEVINDTINTYTNNEEKLTNLEKEATYEKISDAYPDFSAY